MEDNEFLQNGCNCVTVENQRSITLKELHGIFPRCLDTCQPIRVAKVDGRYVLILPSCMSEGI